ncbi:MAG TPA: hypothetical protein VM536_22645 [Chloroflexia bacterium]|nr:hypothetical protein [Chloroflexia bacterium]
MDRNPDAALQALCDYGPRYATVVERVNLGFAAPAGVASLAVVERLDGNAATDFGVPDVPPVADSEPVDDGELWRLQLILDATWLAFDAAAAAGWGQVLRKGPRGGGRETDAIIRHVLGAESGYLAQTGHKLQPWAEAGGRTEQEYTRQEIREALAASAHGHVAPLGSRGGRRWTARYFVRREDWHVLDHAWEIEDRMT